MAGASFELADDRVLPKEKILFQGDFSVIPGEAANDHVKALMPILEKLNVDFDRYIKVHTSATPQTKADVWKAYQMRVGSSPEEAQL